METLQILSTSRLLCEGPSEFLGETTPRPFILAVTLLFNWFVLCPWFPTTPEKFFTKSRTRLPRRKKDRRMKTTKVKSSNSVLRVLAKHELGPTEKDLVGFSYLLTCLLVYSLITIYESSKHGGPRTTKVLRPLFRTPTCILYNYSGNYKIFYVRTRRVNRRNTH